MAKISRFEEIEAWRKARSLTTEIYQVTDSGKFATDFALKNQIRRASISVMSNIAEGFQRGGNKEFVQVLYIARGSLAEVQSQLYIAVNVGFISEEQFAQLSNEANDVGNLIGGFIRYLAASKDGGDKQRRKAPNSEL